MNKDEIKVYSIIIHYDPRDVVPYEVKIPDLDGIIEGYSIEDAIMMAKDYIGTYSLVRSLPPANYILPKVSNSNDIVTLAEVNVSEYQRKYDNNALEKL